MPVYDVVMSPDGHFIVDRHRDFGHVTFAAGLSGHGLKFAGVLGEILADLVLTGATPQLIEYLSARRFEEIDRSPAVY